MDFFAAVALEELAIVFFATVVVGLTGFGFNVFAVPALAWILPAKEAVVIALVAGALINAALATATHARQEIAIIVKIIVASLPGMAIGAYLYTRLPETIVQIVVGGMVAAFALVIPMWRERSNPRPDGLPLTLAVGTSSGILTTLTGTGGPPVVAFLMRGDTNAPSIRASMAMYSAAVSLVGVGLLTAAQAVDADVVARGVILAVPGAAGLLIGSWIFARRQEQYATFTSVMLLVMGVITVWSAFSN